MAASKPADWGSIPCVPAKLIIARDATYKQSNAIYFDCTIEIDGKPKKHNGCWIAYVNFMFGKNAIYGKQKTFSHKIQRLK